MGPPLGDRKVLGGVVSMDLDSLIPVKTVGGGSVTEVIQVQNLETGDLYALKLAKGETPFPSEIARHFLLAEAQAHQLVRKSKSPYFQKLVQDGSLESPGFLLLEWLEGKTLRNALNQNGPLEVSEAVGLCRQVAQALAALHQGGMAHGDIHPDNILLGDDGIDRLIDLGCAHRPHESAPDCEGLLIGSADYWSPEACSTNGFSGPETDVFALGVVLFEAITGFRPWPSGSDLRENIRRRHGDPPKQLPSTRTDIPPGLSQLLEKMLARKLSIRPKSRMVVAELIRLELSLMGSGSVGLTRAA
jgi:serine/threonine protein kinase